MTVSTQRLGAPPHRSLGYYLPKYAFPAERGTLVCEARRWGAPQEVIALLCQLASPPAVYRDLHEVVTHLAGGWGRGQQTAGRTGGEAVGARN
jgi:Protein of unknown function (DUF2795)